MVGFHAAIIALNLDVLLKGNWEEYRNNYNISGTKNLFMIPFESDVTEADIRKTEQVLDYYVGGLDGISEANKFGLIDMFTDSGFRHGTYRLINILVERGIKVRDRRQLYGAIKTQPRDISWLRCIDILRYLGSFLMP